MALDEPVAIHADFGLKSVPLNPDRGWTGRADVLTCKELQVFAREAVLDRQMREGAEAVISKAEAQAASIMQRARQQARVLGDSQLRLWQEAFDARQAELSDALGTAVSTVVHAVLKSLLGSSEDLPVRASIELAMKVMTSELRAAAVCHPLDLPLVQSQVDALNTGSLKADASLPRGQIVFTGDEGEVRIDGHRVLDRLVDDLRQVLSATGRQGLATE